MNNLEMIIEMIEGLSKNIERINRMVGEIKENITKSIHEGNDPDEE